jgi:hypothetical protein
MEPERGAPEATTVDISQRLQRYKRSITQLHELLLGFGSHIHIFMIHECVKEDIDRLLDDLEGQWQSLTEIIQFVKQQPFLFQKLRKDGKAIADRFGAEIQRMRAVSKLIVTNEDDVLELETEITTAAEELMRLSKLLN